MHHLNRRTLLAAAASLSIARSDTTRADPSIHYDVIVVGGGTAGIPCALFAAMNGARVLLIEKSPALGGTLFWSTGQIAGAGTVFQKRLGITDSPDAHYDDCMRINENTADPALTRLTVDHAGDTINWLADQGFEVMAGHPVTGIGHDHFTARRYQQGVKSGLSILDAFLPSLEAAIARQQVTLLTGTAVQGLIQERPGKVVGVTATGPSGTQDFKGSHIVLASGGCAANPRLFEELHGVPLYAKTAYPTSQGDGLILGMSAGAAIVGGEKYASLPGLVPDAWQYPAQMYAWAPLHPMVRQPWEILVNAHGERFVREDHPSVHQIERGIYRQPGHRHWVIFDADMLAKSEPIIPDWSRDRLATEYQTHPMFNRAMSLEELLKTHGAIEHWMGLIFSGESIATPVRDDRFGLCQHVSIKDDPVPVTRLSIDAPFYLVHAWMIFPNESLAMRVNQNLPRLPHHWVQRRPGIHLGPNVCLGAFAPNGAATLGDFG